MGRKIVGFLAGLVISAVAFSMIAVFTAKDRLPSREDQEVAKPLPVAPDPPEMVEETPPQLPAPVEPPEAPVAAAEPEPVEPPTEAAPVVVAESAPQPEPAPTDPPQPKLPEPEQQAPLQKPEVLTEAPPAPQPVAPVPNPPLKIAKADPVPEPAPEPVPDAMAGSPAAQQPVPAANAATEVTAPPVIRKPRLPVVSDDTTRSTGIQFGTPHTSGLPIITGTDPLTAPVIPVAPEFQTAPPPTGAKRLVAPKSVQPEPGAVTILKTEPEVPQAAPEKTRAIDAFGVSFNAGDKPTMSIILVDVGNSGVPLNAAATLDVPVTFAVPVDRPDATLAANRYFENGHEVLALSPRSVELSLSGGQSMEQVADLLTRFFNIIPQSIGLLDVPEATLQNDRVLSHYVLAALHETGHGLVTYEEGLNVAKREADKAGVPAGLIYRAIDQKGESVDAIERHLDRAAAEASRTGHVLVIGSTRADTIKAIETWAQSRAARAVALAPVSASIR